ncbi:MAG: aldehyde dehydrogenase family protein [Smithella sp.]
MSETKEERTSLINPATGENAGYIRQDSIDVLDKAVKKAKIAQGDWAKKPFNERAIHILAIRDFVAAEADRIVGVIATSTGKTRVDALIAEVIPAAMSAGYYAKKAELFLRKERLRPGNLLFANKISWLERVPWGVIGIISPWNYPFAIPFHEVVMALMAGNAVVLKVATQSQEVGEIIVEVMNAGQLPDGLFNLVNLPGHVAGDAFIGSGINKLFFTGSVAVGKDLMAKAAVKLLPLSLELGGNDAMIVCNDADLQRAAGGALWAGFSNCGQSCGGVEHVFVEKRVYAAFTALLREKTAELRQGYDQDFNVDIGALGNREQLEKVKAYVHDALEKGAKITSVSRQKEPITSGFFHPAMILEDVNDSMMVMQEEIFGPILAVRQVEDIEEAICRANDSHLGLTASVWTTNHEKGRGIASRLQAGTVMINDHLMSHGLPQTPWGGFKESGIGRTHGRLGLEEMTQPRVIIDDIMPRVKKNMWWYPHGKEVYEGLKGVLNFLYAPNTALRLQGMTKMLKLFARTFKR